MNYNEHLFELADALDRSGNQKVASKVDKLLMKLAQEEKQGLIAKIKDMVASGAKSLKDLFSEHAGTVAKAVGKNPDMLKVLMDMASGAEGVGLEELLASLSVEDLALLLL